MSKHTDADRTTPASTVANRWELFQDGAVAVYLVPDPRGESQDYRALSLEGFQDGRRVWTEGLRKDLSTMRPDWRAALAKLGVA